MHIYVIKEYVVSIFHQKKSKHPSQTKPRKLGIIATLKEIV